MSTVDSGVAMDGIAGSERLSSKKRQIGNLQRFSCIWLLSLAFQLASEKAIAA
jgi:hypothetical protein